MHAHADELLGLGFGAGSQLQGVFGMQLGQCMGRHEAQRLRMMLGRIQHGA